MIIHFINPFLKALLVITIMSATLFFNAFAQSNNATSDKQIRIKISRDENGKRTEIDTTFTDSDAADAFMKSYENDQAADEAMEFNFNDDNDDADHQIKSFSFNFNDDSIIGRDRFFNLNMKIPEWSAEDRAKMEAEMEQLRAELKKNFHSFDMHWDTTSSGKNFNYNFNFQMPDEKEMEKLKEELKSLNFDFDFNMPPMPPMPDFNYDVQGLNDADKQQFEEQMKKAEKEYEKAMELLKEKNGIIKYPPPPCPHSNNFNNNEKADKKSQQKIIILERGTAKKNKNNSSKKTNLKIEEGRSDHFQINNLKYFPNPNNGKFELSFSLPDRDDLEVKISNAAGEEIYFEKLLDFSGEYEQTFNISENGAGVYLLSIKQGKEWLAQKNNCEIKT